MTIPLRFAIGASRSISEADLRGAAAVRATVRRDRLPAEILRTASVRNPPAPAPGRGRRR